MPSFRCCECGTRHFLGGLILYHWPILISLLPVRSSPHILFPSYSYSIYPILYINKHLYYFLIYIIILSISYFYIKNISHFYIYIYKQTKLLFFIYYLYPILIKIIFRSLLMILTIIHYTNFTLSLHHTCIVLHFMTSWPYIWCCP